MFLSPKFCHYFFPVAKRPILQSVDHNAKKILNYNCFSTCSTFLSRSVLSEVEDDEKLWVCSKTQDLKPCVNVTVPELIRANIKGWGNAIAFECAATGVKYTHNQVLQQSRGFASSLMKSKDGFERGDVIAVMAHNIPEYCTVVFGIWEAGLVATTINPVYTPNEIKTQLISSGAKAIVTLPEYLPTARSVKSQLATLKSIIVVGEAHEGCHTFHEMTKTDTTGVNFSKGSQFDTSKETALLPYSSGTTGLPKGVMLTHSSLGSNIIQYNHPDVNVTQSYSENDGQARLVGVLPFFHSFSTTCVMLSTMWKGSYTMTIPKFTSQSFIDVLQRHKPTDLHVVPPIISFMVTNDLVTKELLSETRSILSGAAFAGPALIQQIQAKTGRFACYQEGYGLTELSPVTHFSLPQIQNTKIGSCGPPLPLTKTKIVDIVNGRTCSRFEKGELWVKGPQMMKGYLNNDKATRQAIDQDGWFHTGDIGYYDDDGWLYLVDRIKELIKVKGLQVSPSELEDVLRSHDKVADVAVIGVPDSVSGELPRAYVVPKSNEHENLSSAELDIFLQDKVAPHKQLRGGIEFVQEIPKSAAGKILRKVLRADFEKKCGRK